MKKLFIIIIFILLSYDSFSQFIIYESTDWSLLEYMSNGDEIKNRTNFQDSCTIFLQSYCENSTNTFWIDLKFENKWYMLMGSIDKVIKSDNIKGYSIIFSSGSDLIKGADFSLEKCYMYFEGYNAMMGNSQYAIVFKNLKVRIEH